MSLEYYFQKWKNVLHHLENLIQIDRDYQLEKAHDQLLSEAVHRLTSILGQYLIIYNDVMDCVRNNLQVQKAVYMKNILGAITSRILELKHQLLKLEYSNYQFISEGLAEHFHTSDEAEMTTVPEIFKRSPLIQTAVDNILEMVKERNDINMECKGLLLENENKMVLQNYFMAMIKDLNKDEGNTISVKSKLSEESRVTSYLITIIKAHEKLRQTTRTILLNRQRREAWRKELEDTRRPPARYDIREKSATLIQSVFRTYFKIKRRRIVNRTEERILDMRELPVSEKRNNCLQKSTDNPDRSKLYDKYQTECSLEMENFKDHYIARHGDCVMEDSRERIREWFYEWFNTIQYIHEIPEPGSVAIFREDVPEPHEWLEEYKQMMAEKLTNKGKSPQQLRYEALQAKREEAMAKKLKNMQQKAEMALMKKMMKQPNLHPGYHYPQSNKMEHLLKVLDDYHSTWDYYDKQHRLDTKTRYINEVNRETAYSDAKLRLLGNVDLDMKMEFHKLKEALRKDYLTNNETMPEITATRTKRRKKKRKPKLQAVPSRRFEDKFQCLADGGFIKNYPDTKLEDYVGDPNFAGEDLRRLIIPASPQNYEIRSFWWKQCYSVNHGFQSVLLVGSDGSGKKKLVHALATINNAVIFELNPLKMQEAMCTALNLKLLSKDFVFCARIVQPSIIYIRHIEKLFLKKKNKDDANAAFNFISWYFIKNLFKNIHKQDNITVIGTCSDPWLTNSKAMLKRFPTVILLADNTYSYVVEMLKNWVLKIAAHGLTPEEVHNYILENNDSIKSEYDRYLDWYRTKTPMGKKEMKHVADQKEFRDAMIVYEQKKAKKKRAGMSAPASAATSNTDL